MCIYRFDMYINRLTSALLEKSISMKRDPQKRPIYIKETKKKGPKQIYIWELASALLDRTCVLQFVVVRCSLLQCVVVCCPGGDVCYSGLRCDGVCGSAL